MNWFEILKEFQGIIGAITGVIATMVVSQMLRNAGTVKIHSEGLRITSSSSGPEPGEEVFNSNSDRFTAFEIRGLVLFENTSENTKAIHNVKLEIHTNGNIKEQDLQDATKPEKTKFGVYFKEITHFNIPPKQLQSIVAKMSSNPALMGYQHGISEIFLSYEIADKKIFKKKKVKMKIL
ncbi:hypothetical protein B481_2012 [Planococcus halocryophilus Or1]|uniref:Uncharacterized protein n=1 Tax=Planococcus halocryophilus TaxID=1215089 RepID=A0A1C7DPE0_9BACL|nr:hypothetical protein [Planococcus halocryophilus]ANU13480.1 hypothetical protein BBI08_06320 [Planococcus halocryophilus]EMF46285.1 hypothetical protein B481_2012 [Planococcus halocryophilus Or1]